MSTKRINITIPESLYDEIQKHKLQINISRVCTEAIQKRLEELKRFNRDMKVEFKELLDKYNPNDVIKFFETQKK
jgi:hypothetical protein